MMFAWLVAISLPALAPPPSGCTALQTAVLRGDDAAVQKLAGRRMLGMGAPAVQLEERGAEHPQSRLTCSRRTALMVAAERGQLKSAQVLVTSGASLTALAALPELGDEAFDARCLALAAGFNAIVTLLEKAGATPAACTNNARLFQALTSNRADLVERQLRAHPSAATLDAGLRSLVGKHSSRVLDLLITAGVEAKLDFTPLYDAALVAGDIGMVHQLSTGGATVTGGSALSQAISLMHPAAIPSLLAAGARTDAPEVRTAIVEAIRERRQPILRALVAAGYRGDDELPLLLHAVRHLPGLVPELLQAGAGLEIDDESGTTPLIAAAEVGNLSLVELLVARGASPRTGDILCDAAIDAAQEPKLFAKIVERRPESMGTVLPGRAARRLGITCGTAKLSVTFDPDYEIYLPTAQWPMRTAMEHRVNPGLHELKIRQRSTGAERRMTVNLTPGLNSLTEKFFNFSRQPKADLMLESLPQHQVFEVVAAQKGAISKCVVEQRRRAPGVNGKLVMRWTVKRDGKTTKVEVASTEHASTYLAGCLKGLIKGWAFAAHADAQVIVFPFKF